MNLFLIREWHSVGSRYNKNLNVLMSKWRKVWMRKLKTDVERSNVWWCGVKINHLKWERMKRARGSQRLQEPVLIRCWNGSRSGSQFEWGRNYDERFGKVLLPKLVCQWTANGLPWTEKEEEDVKEGIFKSEHQSVSKLFDEGRPTTVIRRAERVRVRPKRMDWMSSKLV